MNGDSSTTAMTPVPAGPLAWRTVARRPPRTDLVGEWAEPAPTRAGG